MLCPQCLLNVLPDTRVEHAKYVVNGEPVCSIFCAFARSTPYDRLFFVTPYRNPPQPDLFEGERYAPDD